MKLRRMASPRDGILVLTFLFLLASWAPLYGQSSVPNGKTRLAVIGLNHDHVWGLLKDLAAEPNAELVAIADNHSELVDRAKANVPASVKFYSDYVPMLNEMKPDGVIVTTENDRHLEILRECAKRHIHYSTEKPMATTAADAREMELRSGNPKAGRTHLETLEEEASGQGFQLIVQKATAALGSVENQAALHVRN